MATHMRLDCTCKVEYQSIEVSFNIRNYSGDLFIFPV